MTLVTRLWLCCFVTSHLAVSQDHDASCLVRSVVWAQRGLSWESPPKEAGLNIRTTKATLFAFASDGSFARIGCRLIKQPDGTIAMSLGNGFNLFRGTWSLIRQELRLRFSLVDARLLPVGKTLPGPEQTESGLATGVCRGKLTVQGVEYRELKGMLKDDQDRLLALRKP